MAAQVRMDCRTKRQHQRNSCNARWQRQRYAACDSDDERGGGPGKGMGHARLRAKRLTLGGTNLAPRHRRVVADGCQKL